MAANAWVVYDVFLDELGNETHDLNAADVLKVALHTSTYTPDTANDLSQSAIGNECAQQYGYTTGGDTSTGGSWSTTAGTLTFDGEDVSWDASGGSIVCRYAVLYNSSAGGSNDLIAYSLLDNAPADVTVTDGNTLTISMNASGILTIS